MDGVEEAISVKNISKTYANGKETTRALDGVSLSVNKGEIFGLLGPNGAGKTSLISILAGILSPDGGEAKILGMDCIRKTKAVQRQINVISGFTGVPNSITCEEALTYYCLLYNVKNAKVKITQVLELVGLGHARKRVVEDFSSGMKQKYIIAKGLLNDPKVLILDEPTVGLDIESAISIRALIHHIRKEGRTILLTTHNMFEAEELCDRIAFINHGKIIDVGTPSELKTKVVSRRIVEINCSNEQRIASIVAKVAGIAVVSKSKNLVRVSVDRYSRMNTLLRSIADSGSVVFSVNELEPTLEETYLKLINPKIHKLKKRTGLPSSKGEARTHRAHGDTNV